MNNDDLLNQLKNKLESTVNDVVKDFSNKLSVLLQSIVSEKIKMTEYFITTEAELLEEFSTRNITELKSSELLDLMLRLEKLINNSLEYLNQVKEDIKMIKPKEVYNISTEETPLLSLTPQQREKLRLKILEEIEKMELEKQ